MVFKSSIFSLIFGSFMAINTFILIFISIFNRIFDISLLFLILGGIYASLVFIFYEIRITSEHLIIKFSLISLNLYIRLNEITNVERFSYRGNSIVVHSGLKKWTISGDLLSDSNTLFSKLQNIVEKNMYTNSFYR